MTAAAGLQIDVCNGDADGLCAVVQWRLHDPVPARLVTGLKREIELLRRVQVVPGDRVLVCDLSMRRNMKSLLRILAIGAPVRYVDHHAVDRIPVHPLLDAHIDVASHTCTSLITDHELGGAFRAWAWVGAYGDNLTAVADQHAIHAGLSSQDRQRLRILGEAINYNAYGTHERDVHIPPAQLYERLVRFSNPLDFMEQDVLGQTLPAIRNADLQRARFLPPQLVDERVGVYLLPDAPWSHRVCGTWANALATSAPGRAHAVLTATGEGDFAVNLRAPLCSPFGAAELCRQHGGDGRAGAAGIDHLPAQHVDAFIKALKGWSWKATQVPARTA